ncbi:N-acetylglucosamine related transporter, NagX [hydrothermal vent metagenome]|uniref:N-acetylglucosamine related transporter, NagX n=1 Tax=hydrothermal vent metagenome TaxID=652676 RepID=A0A3B1CFC2_9ZZZZ
MTVTKKERLLSLDIFRGITILLMILVNNPGSWSHIYSPLEHAEWNGCTPTDLVFPFFLFIVGVTTVFSLSRIRDEKHDLKPVYIRLVRRSATLILLGWLLGGFPHYDLNHIRIPGVLPRIGVVYFFTALIFLKIKKENIVYLLSFLLLLYWGLMTLIPVPGVGYPNLEPTTNLAAWLDRTIMGNHLWSGTKVWDPEGILSTIPAIGTALLGVLTGYWLKSDKDKTTKTVWMFYYGVILMALGYVWNFWFPINKGIWTSSYVVYTGGLALVFLAVCYWLIDVQDKKWWIKPFHIYGTNAIAVFFLSGLMGRLLYLIKVESPSGETVALKTYIYQEFFLSFFSPINASLMYAITFILLWLFLMWLLYRKNIFIKV